MKKLVKKSIAVILVVVSAMSSAIISFAAESYSFSVSNMVTSCAISDGVNFDLGVEDGGFVDMGIAYLARWDGPVNEIKDPFPISGRESDLVYNNIAPDYHVQDIALINTRYSCLDNADMKKAIVNHGAIYASFYADDRFFNNNGSTFYMPEGKLNPYYSGGHAITVIGWDDNFSKNKFRYKPEGDGAFICKNSWGKSSGEKGYFYISYYDSGLAFDEYSAAFYGVEDTDNYNKIYQYDPLGPSGGIGNDLGNSLWTANVFPPAGEKLKKDEDLKAVSFYTDAEGMKYEVFVCKNFTNKSSLKSAEKVAAGMMPEAGYHTVRFNSVSLSAGSRFAVIVKFINPYDDSGAGTYMETPVEELTSEAKANKGESFISYDNVKWEDLTDKYENSNVCIKAFTDIKSSGRGNKKSNSVGIQAVNNKTRASHSNKVYSLDELISKGCEFNQSYIDYVKSGKADSENIIKPSPFKIKSNPKAKAATLPAKYDLRDYNCVTPVRNQKYTGTCWAFAICASLESCMLKNDAGLVNSIGNSVYGVKAEDITVKYRQQFIPQITVDCDAGDEYYVEFRSLNKSVVDIDDGGLPYACGTGTADVEVIVKDYYGNVYKDTFTVKSKLSFGQWLIVIFLLGFIWY